jgi:hypothetical protein
MSVGYRAVQSAHAAIDFTFEHPGRAGPWHKDSNYLVFLELKNEKQLKLLIFNCERLDLKHTVFREPDIDNQITAVAIEPSPITQKLVSKIPLLLNTIFSELKDMHSDILSDRKKRRRIRKRDADRVARGYKFRKKTSLEQYKALQNGEPIPAHAVTS